MLYPLNEGQSKDRILRTCVRIVIYGYMKYSHVPDHEFVSQRRSVPIATAGLSGNMCRPVLATILPSSSSLVRTSGSWLAGAQSMSQER
jgi:hypothetical protein